MKKAVIPLLFLFSVVLTLSACQNASEKEPASAKEGIAYYKKGDYQQALPLLEKAANAGNRDAALYLGKMYAQGKGTEKNFNLGFEWYLKAAEAGNRNATYAVVGAYLTGTGVEKDPAKALKWLKKAVENIDEAHPHPKDKSVYFMLGGMYLTGQGTLQDFSEAAKWFEKAAERGHTIAQGNMAFLYYSGQGVLMNTEKALYWAEKAAAQNEDTGEFILGMYHQFREEPPDMEKAIYWYEKAAAQKNYAALFQLGTIYENGLGVPKDLAKAHVYYRQAARDGKKDELVQLLRDFEKEHHLENTD